MWPVLLACRPGRAVPWWDMTGTRLPMFPLSTVLFPRLGIADQIREKSRKIEGTPVGAVVARGEAEIGFQQISELLPVPGIDYVGPLPAELQKVTVFSAGLAATAREPDAARALITFLASPAAAPAITKSGLEPVTSK